VRSQQIVEDGTAAQSLPAGVPGATSNQPPATGTAPINGAAAPLGVAANGDKAGSARRESVINFEVDKTVRVVREASGTVRRLTAAVVVNHRNGTDAKTGKATSTPIPPEQIEQMTALVRETIGFNKDRGDSVNLMNAPFNESKPANAEAPAWWLLPDNQELARSLAFPAGMVALGLLVLLGLVRPALKTLKPTPVAATPVAGTPPQLSAVLNEPTERPGLPQPDQAPEVVPTTEQQRLADAKRLALENPVAVANIVKAWVNGDVTV
jgi:flagellar M-ring protein FliF